MTDLTDQEDIAIFQNVFMNVHDTEYPFELTEEQKDDISDIIDQTYRSIIPVFLDGMTIEEIDEEYDHVDETGIIDEINSITLDDTFIDFIDKARDVFAHKKKERKKKKNKVVKPKKPSTKKPSAKKPSPKKPSPKKPSPKKPKKPSAKKPSPKKPSAKKPSPKKPSAKKPSPKKPSAKKPPVKKSSPKKPKKPSAKKPKKPSAKKPLAKKPLAKKPLAKKPLAKKKDKCATSKSFPLGTGKDGRCFIVVQDKRVFLTRRGKK